MSDNVEKCEDNAENDQCNRKREWDCNSSSGGSVYQEFHGRQEEAMYSTDDEFLDATETIRSPFLIEDPEEQLSAPILKQLRQEKEQTRYIVVDMLTDSESVNNIMEHCKQNFENIVEVPGGETDSDCSKTDPYCNQTSEELPNVVTVVPPDQKSVAGPKPEKNKVSRTLRLPSTVALPNVKPDKPARGDGRPSVGVSKIPLPVSSGTKLQQNSTTPEQNNPASVTCSPPTSSVPIIPEPTGPINTSKPQPKSAVRPSSKQSARPTSRALTRPSSLPKDNKMDTGNENNSPKESPTNEETYNPPFAPEKLIISKDGEPDLHAKPRIKRARSQNKSVEDEQNAKSVVNSTSEGAETKRMRIANKPPSREEPEKRLIKPAEPAIKDPDKRKKEIEAVRHRLAKDRLNLINSRETDDVNSKQIQLIVDSNIEQKSQDPLKSENTQKPASRKSDKNGTSQPASRVRASSSNAGLEKNTAMHEKVPSSQRQLSPLVMNMSIVEKRRQMRQSREAANGDQKLSTKNANMPEIKPPLFKSNQLKTNQLGQRNQENVPIAPMKSAVEDESLRKKTTLVEKRKMMMKQKEATINANKPATGDAVTQRPGKGLERASREKPSLLASQRRSSCDLRKPSTGISKSTEKTAIQHSSFTIPDVQEEFVGPEVQAKPSTTSANSKVTLASMQSVYKMHHKRCEEHMGEVKRAKDKLGTSLEKLEALRNQMIQKFGDDAEEIIPPLYVVQNTPTTMSTTKGMNTEVLEEVAESLILLGNNQQLKYDIENLRTQLEEAKGMGYANKKEDDVLQDLRQRIREMSLTLTLAEKRQQTLEDKMKEKQNEIISLSNENKQMSDLFRQRDQQLSALRKQIEEKNKELESVHKKLAEACSSLHEELYNREVSHIEHLKLMEEKMGIEKELQEVDAKIADFEEREECLNTILGNEKIKNQKLQELLSKKEDELNSMQKRLFEEESSSSSNLLIVSDQLQEKDSAIQELEIIKTTLQGKITELCCLISDMFSIRGIEYNSDHIQASLSVESLPQLREELLKVMEERIEEGNKSLNESRSKIVELQNQVKILQIELEDSKMMSERLTNVITHQKPWDVEKPWDEHQRPWSSDMASTRHGGHNIVENVRDNKTFRDGDLHSIMPTLAGSFVCSEAALARNNFNELFVLLERKRRQLLQLERKYQDMEEVHSHCAQKRTRNETRIAQLEMMLAKLKTQGAIKRRIIIYLSGELELHYKGVNVTQLDIIFDDV